MNIETFIVLILLIFTIHMFIRNCWVCMVRQKWLKNCRGMADIEAYDRAYTYNQMMFKFWDWSNDQKHWTKK